MRRRANEYYGSDVRRVLPDDRLLATDAVADALRSAACSTRRASPIRRNSVCPEQAAA
jgi:hypothetical protein